MGLKSSIVVQVIALALASTASAQAATVAPAPEIAPIWPGQAPGTADWTGPETVTPTSYPGFPTVDVVSNVTVPTLVIVRPDAGKSNGTGVVVVPGGGFHGLWVTQEGSMVSRWLADRGFTVFMLKYRVRPAAVFQLPTDARSHPEQFEAMAATFEDGRQLAIMDAVQAMRFVRANAGYYGIATNRVGMVGFSAGALTTMGVILEGPPDARPDFAAPIYGAMNNEAPPKNGPPLFIAAAQDDSLVPITKSIEIFTRWTAAGLPAELHVYEHGDHGFGMLQMGRPVDDWTKPFEAWLRVDGWMSTKAPVGAGAH